MIKLLERKGLAFGADTNASTGFDETIYKLDLPNASDDLLDTGLMLMRETASELTIDPAAVDRERGIILSERRARHLPIAQPHRPARLPDAGDDGSRPNPRRHRRGDPTGPDRKSTQ